MLFSTLSPAGLASAPALRIIGPGHAGRSTTARSGTALVQDAALAWQEVAANTPRFQGAARRLLVEGRRTNAIRNPRAEGCGTGASAAALPTNWWMPNHTSGLSMDISPVAYGGMSGMRLRLYGVITTGSGNETVEFEARTVSPAAASQTRAHSFYYCLSAGTWPAGASFSTRTIAGNNSPSFSLVDNVSTAQPTPTAGLQRAVQTITLSSTLTAGATVTHGFHITGFTANTAADFTLDVFLPQSEADAATPSSPILPPLGTLAAATRSADATSWLPSGGLAASGTVVLKAMLPQAAPFGSSQGLVQIDDGTDQNRLLIRNTSGGATVYGVADSGGSTLAALAGGGLIAGQPFRAALAWSPGGLAFCLSGGAVQTAAITPPGNLSRMLVGHASSALDRAACGEIELIDYHATRLPDAMLQAVTAAA